MPIDFAGFPAYGWSHHYQSQLSPEELELLVPARVVAVRRRGLDVANPLFEADVRPFAADQEQENAATVGDWLLLDARTRVPRRLLERKSLFKRKAAGTQQRIQLIAANIDTLFIVSSCNHEFNIARIERYLALARQAGVTPVVVLTKADLAEEAADYAQRAARLMPGLLAECLDARDAGAADVLRGWCGPGQTVALVGSSGVGKSTLVNTLLQRSVQDTADIRQHDSRGRHTTTGRSLHRLELGGWLLDTPGMRELQLADAAEGVDEVFADVLALAADCRFSDCSHATEPGCAVQAALAEGRLDAERLRRYRKLAAEDARNSETVHERRARARAFGRMARRVVEEKLGRRR